MADSIVFVFPLAGGAIIDTTYGSATCNGTGEAYNIAQECSSIESEEFYIVSSLLGISDIITGNSKKSSVNDITIENRPDLAATLLTPSIHTNYESGETDFVAYVKISL